MIVMDIEADGLLQPRAAGLSVQPHLVELTATKLHKDTLDILGTKTWLCNPRPHRLSPKFTEITGIADADITSAPSFAACYLDMAQWFLGEWTLVTHNVSYDVPVLAFALEQLGRAYQFPWPPQVICTVELTQHITGKYLSLGALYEHLFGHTPEGTAHRAEEDVRRLVECVQELHRRGEFPQ